MRALRAIALLLAMLVVATGCASTPNSLEGRSYYRRNSIHSDSFPPNYSPGGVPRWGSFGRY